MIPTPPRLLSFVLLLLSSGLTGALAAQPTGPREVMNAVFEKGNLFVALSELEWRSGLCLAATQLAVGERSQLALSLTAGTAYAFLGSGAPEGTDVDLYLYDAAGAAVAQDDATDGTPIIEFTPDRNGSYVLELHLVGADRPESYAAVSLLSRGGRRVLDQEFNRLDDQFFASVTALRRAAPALHWARLPGGWCALGYVLGQGEGATLQRLRTTADKLTVTAAGEPSLKNIDLYLADEELRIVAADYADSAFPYLRYATQPNIRYDLRVEVERSRGTGLLLVALLEE